VNQNSLNNLQLGITGFGRLLTLIGFAWLLAALGLGWLVKSFLLLLGLLLLTPVVAFLGFRWWLQKNLVQAACPVCRFELAGLNQTEIQCPSCGEPLRAEQGHFIRITPSDTIDVEAVEVSATAIDEG
jgi:hypothetical protein